jgi:hypothetical protein
VLFHEAVLVFQALMPIFRLHFSGAMAMTVLSKSYTISGGGLKSPWQPMGVETIGGRDLMVIGTRIRKLVYYVTGAKLSSFNSINCGVWQQIRDLRTEACRQAVSRARASGETEGKDMFKEEKSAPSSIKITDRDLTLIPPLVVVQLPPIVTEDMYIASIMTRARAIYIAHGVWCI